MDIKVNDQISIRPGLIYSLNQVRVVVENWAVSGGLYSYTGVERTQNRKYITLPVNLVLHHKLWKSEVQTFIGPYVGLALDGGTYSEKESPDQVQALVPLPKPVSILYLLRCRQGMCLKEIVLEKGSIIIH